MAKIKVMIIAAQKSIVPPGHCCNSQIKSAKRIRRVMPSNVMKVSLFFMNNHRIPVIMNIADPRASRIPAEGHCIILKRQPARTTIKAIMEIELITFFITGVFNWL